MIKWRPTEGNEKIAEERLRETKLERKIPASICMRGA